MNDQEFTTLYPRLAAALSNVEHEAKPRAQFTIDTPTGEQTLRQYVTEAATGIAFYALLCIGLVLAVSVAGLSPWWLIGAVVSAFIAVVGTVDTLPSVLACLRVRRELRAMGVIR
jgi:hypothetical protein